MEPRYPEIRVTVHSRNPCAVIGAVRQALRLAGVDRDEIRSFSREAFTTDEPDSVYEVCDRWADVVIES